jgi:hypothetical protein
MSISTKLTSALRLGLARVVTRRVSFGSYCKREQTESGAAGPCGNCVIRDHRGVFEYMIRLKSTGGDSEP